MEIVGFARASGRARKAAVRGWLVLQRFGGGLLLLRSPGKRVVRATRGPRVDGAPRLRAPGDAMRDEPAEARPPNGLDTGTRTGHRDRDGTSGLRKISPHPGALPSEWERVRRRDWAGRWDWDGTPRPPLSVQSRHERRTEEPLTNLGLDHPCCAARVIPAVRGASVLHRNGGRQPSGLDVHQCGLRAAPVVEQKLDNGERHHHPV